LKRNFILLVLCNLQGDFISDEVVQAKDDFINLSEEFEMYDHRFLNSEADLNSSNDKTE